MKVKLLVFIYLLITVFSFAQPKWKQTESVKEVKLELFHGTQTANFPTTESLDEGSWMYEISHRFSTVRIADKILVLDEGKIIEQGTHEELLKSASLYAEMFNLQAEGYK